MSSSNPEHSATPPQPGLPYLENFTLGPLEVPGRDADSRMAQYAATNYDILRRRLADDPEALAALGGLMGAVSFFRLREIGSRSAAQRYEELALIDPMTGLYNRNALRTGGRPVRPPRPGAPLAERAGAPTAWVTLLMDLDNFKPVNDTYGHNQGDRCLRMVGAALLASVRDEDEAYRLGGDEFAIFGAIRSTGGIDQFVEGVPQRFHDMLDLIHTGDGSWLFPDDFELTRLDREVAGRVRGSFGAHVTHGPQLDRAYALMKADEVMYEVKKRRKQAQAEQAQKPGEE